MSQSTIPDTFHIVWVAGRSHYVDEGTRREIEARLNSDPGKCDTITFDAINGYEVTAVLYNITSIESSDPASRACDRAISKLQHDEADADEKGFE